MFQKFPGQPCGSSMRSKDKNPTKKTCSEQLQSLRVAKIKNLDGGGGGLHEKLYLNLYFVYRKH